MQNLLERLNTKQREAVMQTEGPVLILAGAGSGKTTVLVNRVAYIIAQNGVRPYNILAITFTNKAANEMKERITNMIGDISGDMWMGTFHSVCVKILRRHIDKLGYENNFVIYDTADTTTVIKDCLKELDMNDKNFPPRAMMSIISNAKDDMLDAQRFADINATDYRMSQVAKIYSLYQKKLMSNNALDFDDIIMLTVRLFKEYPEILERYREKFKYIMVDEYQDTNNVQYTLINLLAKDKENHNNLCVVGDDDQSIYKFRGANIRNILDFEKDFPNAKIIKLEQNYRSTQHILDAANSVIHNNRGRRGKSLWTQNDTGEKIQVYTASNEHEEGQYIARQINKLVGEGYKYSDFAVLYRTNAQSRVLEEMFLREVVPYRVLSGLRFYDRKEIKDIIAYLRVIHNPYDDVSLKRIINEPKRGIGLTTVDKIQRAANEIGTSLFGVISVAEMIPELSKTKTKLAGFADMINTLTEEKDNMELSEFVLKVMSDTGYLEMLEKENTTEAQTRIENLNEFMSVVQEHEKAEENADLSTFLEGVALISDIDSYDAEQDAVVMMTIHSAKGLEFPVVFLSGLEEGVFPGTRSIGEAEELEEERRLCYVAITRAKQMLYITKTESRMLYGSTTYNKPSRFLNEIPSEFKEEKSSVRAYMNAKRGISDFASANPFAKAYNPQYGQQSYDNSYSQYNQVNTPYHKPYAVKPQMQKTAQAENVSDNLNFKAGDVVKHKKFGKGVILEAQSIGIDVKMAISFDSVGVKHLMEVFAKLEKMD